MNVPAAYGVCEQITRREARNFSYGIRLLPPPKRRAMSAIYATARIIDDISDGDQSSAGRLTELAAMQDRLDHLGRHQNGGDHPVLTALADVARRYPVPIAAFGELIDGCRADVTTYEYETFDPLVGYCRCVAGSIGRLSVGVYEPDDLMSAWALADSLGVALQLTNILRDVLEDRLAGRVYIPQEDLRRFGCALDIGAGAELVDPPDRFAALVRFEADRAERWYENGLRLLPLLDRRSAACTAAMAGIYHRLLARIAADPDQVRTGRLSLPTSSKLAVAARALLARSA